MSQNAHTLMLFFEDPSVYEDYVTVFDSLEQDDDERTEQLTDKLGIDIEETWHDVWFNHNVTKHSDSIELNFDTSTSANLPYEFLQQLFKAGLKAAALEIFYDQVGEFGQCYFHNNRMVERDAFLKKHPTLEAKIDERFESKFDELEDDGIELPMKLDALIKQDARRVEDAEELIKGIQELVKASSESGENPLELMKDALVLRAMGKGLLYALVFGIATVLLFKGMWFWIVVSLVLAVVLPLYYISDVLKDFEDEDETEEQGGEAC